MAWLSVKINMTLFATYCFQIIKADFTNSYVFAYSSFVIDGRMLVGILGEGADIKSVNFLYLGRIFNKFCLQC